MNKPKTNKQKIKADQLNRTFDIATSNIDEENRTVEVAFSSEMPVKRWFGREILDHAPGAVDLSRLADGGAVLLDHTHRDQVGVVESVRIDGDRRGRAVLRFGRSQQANDAFNDVLDNIKRHISVGYMIEDFEETEATDGEVEFKVTRWQPYEISLVSVPADPSVGVNRNLNDLKEDKKMSDKKIESPATEPAQERTAPTASTNDAVKAERARIADIESAASSSPFDLGELKRSAIENGMTLEQFRSNAFDVAAKAQQNHHAQERVADDMLKTENQEFSIVRAISAQMSGDWKDAGFEREFCQEMARGQSIVGGGLVVPMSVLTRASDTSTGAGLVGTSHLANQFIDSLRSETIVGRLGARFMNGLTGNITIPKKTGSASFGFLGEGDDADESEVTVGNVTMSPKHIGGSVPMTFELMRQSAPAIEQLVRADLLQGMALAIDNAAFAGSGSSNQPRGILNTAGIHTVTAKDTSGKVPTWAEIVGLEAALDDADALAGSLSYVFRPTIKSALKLAKKDEGSGRFVIEAGECNGYGVMSSTNIPVKTSLFGDFSQLMIGSWGMVELVPERNSKTGGLDIGCHQLIDIAVRHAQSFAKII
jgi:HK97 family phage major capsid protein